MITRLWRIPITTHNFGGNHLETIIAAEKWMVGRLVSFWDGLFLWRAYIIPKPEFKAFGGDFLTKTHHHLRWNHHFPYNIINWNSNVEEPSSSNGSPPRTRCQQALLTFACRCQIGHLAIHAPWPFWGSCSMERVVIISYSLGYKISRFSSSYDLQICILF